MSRTVRRMPMTNDTDLAEDINYGYANFASFKGLCDDKNYLGIDQQTFEDANNVYVDTDGQLASRPKLIKHTIGVLNNCNVIKIYNIHGVIFYHVFDIPNNQYEVTFKYSQYSWKTHPCGMHLNVGWFDDKFYFFTDNTIFAYNYESGWLDAESIVYRPVTAQVRNGITLTNEDDAYIDSPNIFGGGTITRYFYGETSSVIWSDLVGKNVVVNIDDNKYEITFKENQQYTFVRQLSKIQVTDCVVNDNGQLIMWNNNDNDQLYYSLDGKTFITLPRINNSGEGKCRPVLSQDGKMLYVLKSTLSIVVENLSKQETYTLSYIDLTKDLTKWSNLTNTVDAYMQISNGDSNYDTRYYYQGYTNDEKSAVAVGYCNDGSDGRVIFIRRASYIYYGPTSGVERQDMPGIMVYTFNGTKLFHFFIKTLAIDSDLTFGCDVRFATRDNRAFAFIYSYYSYNVVDKEEIACDINIVAFNKDFKPYVYLNPIDASSFIPNHLEFVYTISKKTDYHCHTKPIHYTVLTSGFDYQVISNGCKLYMDYLFNGQCIFYTNTTTLTTTTPVRTDDVGEYGDNSLWFTVKISEQSDKTINIGNEINNNIAVYSTTNNYYILTNLRLYINESIISLLHETVKPIAAMFNGGICYIVNNTLYGVNLAKEITIDYVVNGDIVPIIPSFICNFINDVISYDNKINWRIVQRDKNKNGLLYFGKANETSFPSEVTALSLLSQTEVAIFFENEINILNYTDNGYVLQRSKMQLGCRKGYDVILNYDGATTLLCTLKGLTAISYQDFVQSTDQVFTYLSENIIGLYEQFDTSPIKLYQYKNWIVLYKQDDSIVYIYDLRNSSWWKWSFDKFYGTIQQVIYDNEKLIIVSNSKMYILKSSDNEPYFDFDSVPIEWNFRSQKLHFDAPNNYKHINQILITSTQQLGKPFVFNFALTCYRNLIDITDKTAYDYEVDGLKTFIKRINLMKINAFQFELSSYKNQNSPRQFATPNIAIKYRITERIR